MPKYVLLIKYLNSRPDKYVKFLLWQKNRLFQIPIPES